MHYFGLGLILTSALTLIASVFWRRARTFLWVLSFFALLNSYFAMPLNWQSFLHGTGFWLAPIKPYTPAIPLHLLALPTDSPEEIILKMGCYVCHKIPRIPKSYNSDYGPVLIPGTMATQQLNSQAYQERLKSGMAKATTPREYVIESILEPSAFIAPGYVDRENPERSIMYAHYSRRFTREAVETLADYLMTVDVYSAIEDGIIMGHRYSAE